MINHSIGIRIVVARYCKEDNASKAIGKLLVKNNIYFAGIDFVQEKLIGDINVTSPTGLAAYKDLSGVNLAKFFWNNI